MLQTPNQWSCFFTQCPRRLVHVLPTASWHTTQPFLRQTVFGPTSWPTCEQRTVPLGLPVEKLAGPLRHPLSIGLFRSSFSLTDTGMDAAVGGGFGCLERTGQRKAYPPVWAVSHQSHLIAELIKLKERSFVKYSVYIYYMTQRCNILFCTICNKDMGHIFFISTKFLIKLLHLCI